MGYTSSRIVNYPLSGGVFPALAGHAPWRRNSKLAYANAETSIQNG